MDQSALTEIARRAPLHAAWSVVIYRRAMQSETDMRTHTARTLREDSDAVICLHRKHPKNQAAYHAGQLTKEEAR